MKQEKRLPCVGGALACGFMASLLLVSCGADTGGSSVDLGSATAQVEHVERRMIQSFKAKDAAGLIRMYSDDVAVMLPNSKQLKGRAEVQKALTEMMADPAFGIEIVNEATAVAGSGDMAYTRGGYRVSHTDPQTRQPTTQPGYYLVVYRKGESGEWLVVEDISTPGAPDPR